MPLSYNSPDMFFIEKKKKQKSPYHTCKKYSIAILEEQKVSTHYLKIAMDSTLKRKTPLYIFFLLLKNTDLDFLTNGLLPSA